MVSFSPSPGSCWPPPWPARSDAIAEIFYETPFKPPPGADVGIALGCAEAWPDFVTCPSLPNRKAKRRPGTLNKRNKCDERAIHEFIQKLPTPSIPKMLPGFAPGAPVFVPINYEQQQQPSLPTIESFLTPTTPTTITTSSQVGEAPGAPLSGSGSGLLASSSIVDTTAAAGQQQPSSDSSSYLPSSDEGFLSQLSSSLDSSSSDSGGGDVSFE